MTVIGLVVLLVGLGFVLWVAYGIGWDRGWWAGRNRH